MTKDSDFVQTVLLTGQAALLFISAGKVGNVELELLLHLACVEISPTLS